MEKLASTTEMWKRREFSHDPLIIIRGHLLEMNQAGNVNLGSALGTGGLDVWFWRFKKFDCP
jgi:hypothetical protein